MCPLLFQLCAPVHLSKADCDYMTNDVDHRKTDTNVFLRLEVQVPQCPAVGHIDD